MARGQTQETCEESICIIAISNTRNGALVKDSRIWLKAVSDDFIESGEAVLQRGRWRCVWLNHVPNSKSVLENIGCLLLSQVTLHGNLDYDMSV